MIAITVTPHSFRRFFTLHLCLTAVLWLAVLSPAAAQRVVFREDFADADFPANVSLDAPAGIGGPGLRETRDGSHFMQPQVREHMWFRIFDMPPLHSIEMKARLLAQPTDDTVFISLSSFNNLANDSFESYYGGIFNDGTPAAGSATNLELDIAQGTRVPLDTLDWFTLRFDVGRDEVAVRVWDESSTPPASPQLTYPTNVFDPSLMTTANLSFNPRGSTNRPTLEIDYIQVTAVPEPCGLALVAVALPLLCGCRRCLFARARRSEGLPDSVRLHPLV